MEVYKFGGASIATPERMQAILPILALAEGPLVIVMSALGKTTNALEAIVAAACSRRKEEAEQLAANLEAEHFSYATALLPNIAKSKIEETLAPFFTELHWAIEEAEASRYDYHYDQIVPVGELLSTVLFSLLLENAGVTHRWLDARDLVRTDDTYRDARVDIDTTSAAISATIQPQVNRSMVLTQGFIGSTSDNASVTLGREGSDYTAALIASALRANRVTIWKDVEGLLNADPKLFSDTVMIQTADFAEVIEMAFYGAQVIHPKTIKPLQNAGIPLHVRSFLHPEGAGTCICAEKGDIRYPSIFVLKERQVLLQLTTRDFSFITEEALSRIYHTLSEYRAKVNLIQNAAISFVACIDFSVDRLPSLMAALEDEYRVTRNEGVSLLTIRHPQASVVERHSAGKNILLEQRTRQTVQLVF
jgi:aspartate kinase